MAKKQQKQGRPSEDIESVRIPIIGSALNRGSTASKDQRFVNGYFWATKNPVTGEQTFQFVKRPGLTLINQPPAAAAAGRGHLSWGGNIYSVFGTKIYKGTTDLGVTLATSSGQCGFAETRPGATTQYLGVNDGTSLYLIKTDDTVVVLNNKVITSASIANPTVVTATGHGLTTGNKIIIRGQTLAVPELNGTVYTVTVTGVDTFTIPVNVTTAGAGGTIGVFPTANTGHLEYMDGYWFVVKAAGTIWNCDVDDPTLWDPTKFLTAQMFGDTAYAITKHNNLILMLLEKSTQAFYNNANSSGSPLSNYESGAQQVGTKFKNSVASAEGASAWLGNSKTGGHSVWALTGNSTEEIATTQIKLLLDAETTTLSSSIGRIARMGGKKFYILELLTLNRTLIYDFDTTLWSEFESTTADVRWGMCSFSEHSTNALTCQHISNGNIYSVSPTVYQDNAVSFTVLARFGRIDLGTNARKFVAGYEFIGDKQSTTTNVSFQYSDDDYATLSTARTVDMSRARAFLKQGGNFRRRAHQMSYSGANPLRMEAVEMFYRMGDK